MHFQKVSHISYNIDIAHVSEYTSACNIVVRRSIISPTIVLCDIIIENQFSLIYNIYIVHIFDLC